MAQSNNIKLLTTSFTANNGLGNNIGIIVLHKSRMARSFVVIDDAW